jgi:hypothetical protein
LALKYHAVKHGHPGRILKDAEDVIRLIQANRIDPEARDIRELFQKHGTNEMKKSEKPAVENDSLNIELPDWSGMDNPPARITPEAAFRLLEQYPGFFSKTRIGRQEDRPENCQVEFVL